MNKQEVSKLLLKACAAYPNQIELTKEVIAIWCERLEKVTYERGMQNLNRHIDSSRFFPAISDIIKQDEPSHYDTLRLETNDRFKMLKALEARAVTPDEREAIRKRVASGELKQKYANDPYLGGW